MFGKVLGAMIGAGVGFLTQSEIAALVLAAVGAVIGHLYDALHAEPVLWDAKWDAPSPRPRPTAARGDPAPDQEPPEDRGQQERLAHLLCPLFVELARVDGEVAREEVRVMREYFEQDLGLEGRALQRVRNQLKAAMGDAAVLEDAARAVREVLEPSRRPFLLDALYDLALSDGELRRSERDALRRLATALDVDEAAHRAITARYFGSGEAHYAALGLSPSATDEEIRSAYRRLAAQHHPDRAAHLGPEAAAAASRRFQEIKDAYEELRRLRGI